MRKSALILVLTWGLLWVGCDLLGLSSSAKDARIEFGKSIEGVEIGDDTTTVINKLGRPDYVLNGDYPGFFYNYAYPNPDGEGHRDGLSITIHNERGVQGVGVSGPYSGKTSEGIGIGSSREKVLEVLGTPDQSGEGAAAESIVDLYFYEHTRFGITYPEDKVASISMSPRR